MPSLDDRIEKSYLTRSLIITAAVLTMGIAAVSYTVYREAQVRADYRHCAADSSLAVGPETGLSCKEVEKRFFSGGY